MLDAVHMKAENSPTTFSLAVLQIVRRALKGNLGDGPPGGSMPMAQCQRMKPARDGQNPQHSCEKSYEKKAKAAGTPSKARKAPQES